MKKDMYITAEDLKVILDPMKNFYNQLYASQNQPSAACSSTFLEHEFLTVKLDYEKQNLCEGPITAEECSLRLNLFNIINLPAPMVYPLSFIFVFETVFLTL